jgi:hydrogenase maturation protease
MSRIRILGIGSPSGDDQAGWLVIDALSNSGLRAGGDLHFEKLDRPGASLIPLLVQADWVILIDAMVSQPLSDTLGESRGQAGQIRHFDGQSWPDYRHGLSSHGLGVIESLSLARELGELPARMDVYGIEAEQVQAGRPAGEIVQASAQRLAARIAGELSRNSVHENQG